MSSPFNSVEQLVSHFEKHYGDSLEIFYAHEREREIVLDNIEVNTKNKGIGTTIIMALQDYARKVQKPITLTAEPQRRQKTKLDRFYRERGFKKPGKARRYDLAAGHSHLWDPEPVKEFIDLLGTTGIQHNLMSRMNTSLAQAGLNAS